MSRHRNVRAMNIDEEYDGYYDSAYGHSVEEEFCISPRTEAQFLYNRDAQNHSMSAFLDSSPDSHADEYGGNEDGPRVRCDSVNERPNLSSIDRAKLQSCVEAMQNVVGDTISESILIKAATENHFDVEKALDAVLSGAGAFEKPKPPRSKNVNGTKKEFCIHRKYAFPGYTGWASKNNHHYKCNIKPIGYSSHPSIYDPLILDLLKMFIAFIEFFPTVETKCREISAGNTFSSYLKSFYSMLVPFFTKFSSSDVFTYGHHKIQKRLCHSVIDFRDQLCTPEPSCTGHVVHKKFSAKTFYFTSKLLRLLLKLLRMHSSVMKTSLLSDEEHSHLIEIWQIFQFYLPTSFLHPSACIPSSNGLLHCKNHSITNMEVSTKCMPARENCYTWVDDKKLDSFIRSFLSFVTSHRSVADYTQYKLVYVLHKNQRTFTAGSSLPETDCTNKGIHQIQKKGNIRDSVNTHLETYSFLLLCLLKMNNLRSVAGRNVLRTAIRKLQCNAEKRDNNSKCKYQLQHFSTSMKNVKNEHHMLLKFVNFVQSYFYMYEDESKWNNCTLLDGITCLLDGENIEPKTFHPGCTQKKQFIVRNPSVNFSKEVVDVLFKGHVFLSQVTEHQTLKLEKTTSTYKNGKFALFQFDATAKIVIWRDGVKTDCSKTAGSAFCKFRWRMNSASALLTTLFECAGSLCQVVREKYNFCLFPSNQCNPFLRVPMRFMDSIETSALYYTNCCKNADILKSSNEIILCFNRSLSQDLSCVCFWPTEFSSFMKCDVLHAPQSFIRECTSDAPHCFLCRIGSYNTVFSEVGDFVALCKNIVLVAVEYVKLNIKPFLNCNMLSETSSGERPKYYSVILAGSCESDTDKILICSVDLKLPVLPECVDTHDISKNLSTANSVNYEQTLPSLNLVDHYTDYDDDDIQGIKLSTEVKMEHIINPSVTNVNWINSELCLSDPEYPNCNLSMDAYLKFEDFIIVASADTICHRESCTLSKVDFAASLISGNHIDKMAESSETDSDVKSSDDLSLDDMFLSLNSDSIENLLSDTENSLTDYTDTGQNNVVGTELLHSKTSVSPEVENDLSHTDLYLSIESSGVNEDSAVSFKDEPQEIPLLEDPSSAEKCTTVNTVHKPLNVLHQGSEFCTELEVINYHCSRGENVHVKIQSPLLSEPCCEKYVELGAYCCTGTDDTSRDVQRKLLSEDKQLQLSDNLLSDYNCNVASEAICDQCHSVSSEQLSFQHSSLSELCFDNHGNIWNEKNMSGSVCEEQNGLLNKSMANVYLNFRETSENLDFRCTSTEMPALSPLDSRNNTERSDISTKCLSDVQNEVSFISPVNECESESQSFSESNLDVQNKMPYSLSDFCNDGNCSDMLRNSDIPSSQNKTSNLSYGDNFNSPKNCIDNLSEILCDLSFLNSCDNCRDNELPQVLNSATEETSFSCISLSDLYLGNRGVSPPHISNSTDASPISCTLLSPVCDDKNEITENVGDSGSHDLTVLCTNLELTADPATCEITDGNHPTENIALSGLCFKFHSEPDYPSQYLVSDEPSAGSLSDHSFAEPEKETNDDCNTKLAELPSVSLSEMFHSMKPAVEENHNLYAKNGSLLSPSFSDLGFDLEPSGDSNSEAEKNTEVNSSLLDLYINSESGKQFDTDSEASYRKFANGNLTNEFTVVGNMDECGSDYFRLKMPALDICSRNPENDEVDSGCSFSEGGSLKKVSEFFVDDCTAQVAMKRSSTPVHITSVSPEVIQHAALPAGPFMQQFLEPISEDYTNIPCIDLSVAQKNHHNRLADFHTFDIPCIDLSVQKRPQSWSKDFRASDMSSANKKLPGSDSVCVKGKFFSGSQETEVVVKPKKSLFAKVLKCKSKPTEGRTFPKPPQTLSEILESVGYTKYFQFSTPSPDEIVKIAQNGAISSPGSSSTIKPPNLETVEDEKECVFNDREIGGRMFISNGEIKTPDEYKSVKNTPAVPESETDCEKAVEKSDSSLDEEKGKTDEQSSILPAEQFSKLKSSVNDKEVLEAYKKERGGNKPLINLVVIGHVDAGKSTLMGHLLYRLGCVGKKMMHKYEQDSKKLGKSSFMYAWVLDETSEERNRGITMDVAQSKFETPHRSVTLLDAPGHKDFIPNMITGAAQADVAVLVLDSTRGEFETGFEAGGQTREHTMLIRSLGVSQLAVAVNKLDNVNWDQERYKEIVSKLSAFLKQAGFKESEVQFVPCSGLTGENLINPPEIPELKKWYSGPCLVDVIDGFKPPERPISKPLRFCISDVFKGMGSGFCVSGRVEAGYVQNGDKVLVMPAAEQATVKGITIDEVTVQHSFAGDHVTLQLSGVDMNNVTTGCVVCDIARPVKVSARFEARLVIFNITIPITKGFPVILHYQSMSEQAFVKKLITQLHRSTGQVVKKKPRCLMKNSSAVVEIEVIRPICLEVYKDFKELGRFMLRSSGSTIAAGLVTEIL